MKKEVKEIWRPIFGFQGMYEVSNTGLVRSLNRTFVVKGKTYSRREKVLKQIMGTNGYFYVALSRNGNITRRSVHSLVWDSFGNHYRNGLQIDHIDEDKTNNHISNLQILTARQNITKNRLFKKNGTSKYIGVSWRKQQKKWQAVIHIKGKDKNLGSFKNEYEAHLAYQKALSELACY